MTKQEAIHELSNIFAFGFYNDRVDEAVNMAIKALEQEPCEDKRTIKHTETHACDYISRQDAIEALDQDVMGGLNYRRILRLLPSADRPTGHWIENAQEYYEMINEKGGGVDENTPYFTDDIACSECLAKFSVIDNETERFDFCPNCGCAMKGGEEE